MCSPHTVWVALFECFFAPIFSKLMHLIGSLYMSYIEKPFLLGLVVVVSFQSSAVGIIYHYAKITFGGSK